jgi:branched-chain amino acid transport system substrate-binding protein
VTGETVFDSKGDLQHVTVSIFHYQSGKKTLLDVVKM